MPGGTPAILARMMMKTRLGFFSLVLLAGCNGGVNTVGDTPTEAAQEVATAICDFGAACPKVDIECTSDGETTTCTGMFGDLVTEAEHMQCYDALSTEFVLAFEQFDAIGLDRADFDACVNASISQGCPTQAELDAYIAELEAGNEDASLHPNPPECEALGVEFGD